VVVVTTPAFIDLSEKCAEENQLEGARIAVVPHPIGGTPEKTLLARADAAIDELIRRLA